VVVVAAAAAAAASTALACAVGAMGSTGSLPESDKRI